MTASKNHQKLVAAICILGGALAAHAQVASNNPALLSAMAAESLAVEAPYHRFSLSPEVGSMGVGATVGWRFADHFGLRGGVNYFTYSVSGSKEFTSSDFTGSADYKGKSLMQSEPLSLEIYPWRQHSFHLSFGALINQSDFTGKAMPTSGTITIEGTEYPVDPGGEVAVKIKQPTVCPYFSIGGNFFYFDRAHHWSMGGELGAAYGKWDVAVTSKNIQDPTGTLQTDLNTLQGSIQDKLKNYPVWPILKLNICYSF